MVCPFGCVCHAVRAPGAKWTLLALRRDGPDGVATGSTYTTPVNHSRGPVADSTVFLVIFIVALPISRYTSPSSRSSRAARTCSSASPLLALHNPASPRDMTQGGPHDRPNQPKAVPRVRGHRGLACARRWCERVLPDRVVRRRRPARAGDQRAAGFRRQPP